MIKIAAAALLTYITNGQLIECPVGSSCEIDGNSSVVVVAPCGVSDLIINCDSPNQCKPDSGELGLIVYSSANNTEISCGGIDSCLETSLFFGSGPVGTIDNYDCQRSSVDVLCLGKQSCKSINIENTGTVTNGLSIITPLNVSENDAVGAFLDGDAVCGFDTECVLFCGDSVDTCKDATCFDNCVCEGTACPEGIHQRPTLQPTSPPTLNASATNIDNNVNNNVDNNVNNNNSSTPSPVVAPPPTLEPTPSPTELGICTSILYICVS